MSDDYMGWSKLKDAPETSQFLLRMEDGALVLYHVGQYRDIVSGWFAVRVNLTRSEYREQDYRIREAAIRAAETGQVGMIRALRIPPERTEAE